MNQISRQCVWLWGWISLSKFKCYKKHASFILNLELSERNWHFHTDNASSNNLLVILTRSLKHLHLSIYSLLIHSQMVSWRRLCRQRCARKPLQVSPRSWNFVLNQYFHLFCTPNENQGNVHTSQHHLGKFGWLIESGNFCVSRQNPPCFLYIAPPFPRKLRIWFSLSQFW